MSVIATEHDFPGDTFKLEYAADVAYTRTTVTYNGAAKTFAIGDLVGATGAAPALVGDIVGIVRFPVSAPLNTATKVVIVHRGPATVRAAGLNLGALVAADVAAKLETMGIQVLAD